MTTLLEAAEATRLKLREQGHSPIPVSGKRPLIDDWQKLGNISAAELSRLTADKPDHTNTGALTALMPVLDIDIKDAEAAEAAAQERRARSVGARSSDFSGAPNEQHLLGSTRRPRPHGTLGARSEPSP